MYCNGRYWYTLPTHILNCPFTFYCLPLLIYPFPFLSFYNISGYFLKTQIKKYTMSSSCLYSSVSQVLCSGIRGQVVSSPKGLPGEEQAFVTLHKLYSPSMPPEEGHGKSALSAVYLENLGRDAKSQNLSCWHAIIIIN